MAPKALIHTLLSFTTLATAPEVEVEEGLDAGLEVEAEEEDVVVTNPLSLDKDDGLAEGREELVPDEVVLDPNGGGTAALASTSCPTPQGIASPVGWFALAGGVEEPSALSMVKRVVHVLVVVWAEVNW